jgi:TDG/mug DNA glycosylase family protein
MSVVFCGTAVGRRSALRRAYYAGIGNVFWRALHEVGITRRRFEPEEYGRTAALGIGFTDLAKHISGNDTVLKGEHFGRRELRRKILKFKPHIVAFTSKRAAEEFLGRQVDYGELDELIGSSRLFVLTSPSGAGRRWWNIEVWRDLARLVQTSGRRSARSAPKTAEASSQG